MAHVTLQAKCLQQSWVGLAHAVFVKGLPQQHRLIGGFVVRVIGIYSQGVCFLLIDLVDHVAVKHSLLR